MRTLHRAGSLAMMPDDQVEGHTIIIHLVVVTLPNQILPGHHTYHRSDRSEIFRELRVTWPAQCSSAIRNVRSQGKVLQQQETTTNVVVQTNKKDGYNKGKQEGKKTWLYWNYIDDVAQRIRNTQCLITVKYMSSARPVATSEVSQFEGKVHRHFIGTARSHTNHDKLRIGIVQVEERKLPKDFRGPLIGDGGVLVRNFIEEGWSGATCSLLNVIIKCVNHLW